MLLLRGYNKFIQFGSVLVFGVTDIKIDTKHSTSRARPIRLTQPSTHRADVSWPNVNGNDNNIDAAPTQRSASPMDYDLAHCIIAEASATM